MTGANQPGPSVSAPGPTVCVFASLPARADEEEDEEGKGVIECNKNPVQGAYAALYQ